MSKTEHTPGPRFPELPLRVVAERELCITADDGWCIAIMNEWCDEVCTGHGEDRDWAALFAAAPQLLEATKGLMPMFDGNHGHTCMWRHEIAALEAAIAAAPQLLEACKRMDDLVEKLWAAVDWGKTFNLPAQELNEAPIAAKRAIAAAEGSTP